MHWRGRASGPETFHRQQRVLARQAPTIAAQAAVLAQHAVAGDSQRCGVGRAGAGHGPGRRRLAQLHGQLGLSAGGAVGDGLQGAPDTVLKLGACDVQGQVQLALLAAQVSLEHGRPAFQVVVVRL